MYIYLNMKNIGALFGDTVVALAEMSSLDDLYDGWSTTIGDRQCHM